LNAEIYMSATTGDIDITADGRNGKFARSKVSQRLRQRKRAAVITRWLRKNSFVCGAVFSRTTNPNIYGLWRAFCVVDSRKCWCLQFLRGNVKVIANRSHYGYDGSSAMPHRL
jgi:hypothetical protein